MIKSIVSCLFLISIFIVKNELYVVTIYIVLIILFFLIGCNLFINNKLNKFTYIFNAISIILISCFFVWLPNEYQKINSLAIQQMGTPCDLRNCYKVEYIKIENNLIRNYRLSRDNRCVLIMSSHISLNKLYLLRCIN